MFDSHIPEFCVLILTMIPDSNVNKQRNSTTLGQHILQRLSMFHSEILASLNFNKNKILSPGLENNHTLKCCSGNFPTQSYVKIVGKIPDQHLNVWLFSNPGDKVKKDGELWDKSLSTRI